MDFGTQPWNRIFRLGDERKKLVAVVAEMFGEAFIGRHLKTRQDKLTKTAGAPLFVGDQVKRGQWSAIGNQIVKEHLGRRLSRSGIGLPLVQFQSPKSNFNPQSRRILRQKYQLQVRLFLFKSFGFVFDHTLFLHHARHTSIPSFTIVS